MLYIAFISTGSAIQVSLPGSSPLEEHSLVNGVIFLDFEKLDDQVNEPAVQPIKEPVDEPQLIV